MRIVFVSFVIAIMSCTSHDAESNNTIQDTISNSNNGDTVKINGSLGVIVTSELYSFGEQIEVFDTTLRPLKALSVIDEYQVLTLRCLSTNGAHYLVIFPDGKFGHISKENKKIVFQTWSEHILDVFSIGFDNINNPIRISPDNSSSVADYNNEEFYHPVKIQMEWLQIKWETENNWEYGWIKWHDKETLLVDLFYFG